MILRAWCASPTSRPGLSWRYRSASRSARARETTPSRYWRKVHKDYFVLQCEQWGVEWRDDHLVRCEGFALVAMA